MSNDSTSDLTTKPSGQPRPDSPSSSSSGLFGTVKNLISLHSWLQSRKPKPVLPSESDVDAMVVDEDSSRALRLKKEDSFVTVSTQPVQSQSSQEYELSWIEFSPEDLEQVAANAERIASAAPAPPMSRETSGSSLGKRPRADSIVGSPGKKRANRAVEDESDNPFIASKEPVDSSSTTRTNIIAQPPEILKKLIQGLAWGVQWEIARLVTGDHVTYTDVARHLHNLTGANEQAADRVVQLLRPIVVQDAAGPTDLRPIVAQDAAGSTDICGHVGGESKAVWAELDREETALQKDPLAGLGVQGHAKGRSWYGGQVQFTARLKEKIGPKGGPKRAGHAFDIVLQTPELGPSNRFARRFGSRRFIRVRVPKAILSGGNKPGTKSPLIEFFRAPFLLHGRVFRSFCAKDSNVFLVETNDPDISEMPPGITPMSFNEFLDFHNPRTFNSHQAMAKWSARFALGLSNSVPGLLLAPENIHCIPDIVAWEGKGKPPPEKILTDGCGYINAHALRQMQAKLQWEKFPTAVQVRVDGAKGLLILHPDGKYTSGDNMPQIWLRPSQVKIQYDQSYPPDPARLVIDVLQPARLKYPARLSAETIINISHNQTGNSKEKHKALRQLMQDGLKEVISGLVRWSDVPPVVQNEAGHTMQLLWHEVSKAGGIMGMRMAREFSGTARARGFASRWDDEEEEKEEEMSPAQILGEVPSTGCPPTAEETAMDLLAAGFVPRESKFLNEKLKYIVKKVANRYTQKYRIGVPGSAEAWCVPDPFNVLEPGEIFLRTSQPIKNTYGIDVDVLQGDVLVTRYPTKTPSDIQKVKAVFKPELFEYTDLVIFSVKGDRSLASLLSGGDYDGDTVTIIWEPGLVEPFVNADLRYSLPPEGHDSNFETEANETVAEFQSRSVSMPNEALIQDLTTVLLGTLGDRSVVGSYSIFHDNAVYSLGYGHPETTRLAYMFCSCLDGAKSGLRVKSSVFKADKIKWDTRGPQWKEVEESDSNKKPLHRGENLGTFIMDDLKSLGENLSNQMIIKWEGKLKPRETPDPDLLRPWKEAEQRVAKLHGTLDSSLPREEMSLISDYVSRVREQYAEAWKAAMSPSRRLLKSPSGSGNHSRSPNLNKINDNIILEYSRGPDKQLLFFTDLQREELKASYAYLLDSQKSPEGTFAFKIAFRELLRIKATSVGGLPVTSEFHRCFDIQSGVKALGKQI